MHIRKRWLWAFGLLVLAVILPQFLTLNSFRRAAHRALERELRRTVEFSSLTARLLPRPSLLGRDFVLHELPEFGAEPFLYAREVRCNLSLAVLWRWRLECAQLHLVEPRINLTRNAEGVWNLEAVMANSGLRTGVGGPARKLLLLTATGGRINFKWGADKQRYALTGVRFRIEPEDNGFWSLQLEATPMRTDRTLPDAGQIRLQGRVAPAGEYRDIRMELEGGLERGSLSQLLILAGEEEDLVRATVSGKVQVEGRLGAWRGTGNLVVDGLRRWDLAASENTPRWEADFAVAFSDETRTLRFEQVVVRAPKSELRLAGSVGYPGGRREWTLAVDSVQLDLGEWMGQLASLKENVTEGTRVEGAAQLHLRASNEAGAWTGELAAAAPVQLYVPGRTEPVELTGFRLLLSDRRLELLPLSLRFSPEEELTVRGEAQLGRESYPYRLNWQSENVRLLPLKAVAAAFGLNLMEPGLWEGQAVVDLEWTGRARAGFIPRWQGTVELRGARANLPEFNQWITVPLARLVWERGRLRVDPLELVLADGRVTARLERRALETHWTVHVTAGRLRLATLNNLFNPEQRSLFERLLRTEQPRRTRWDRLWVSGELNVDELVAGPFRFNRVRAQGELRNGRLELTRLRFRGYGGRFNGSVRGDFTVNPPQYRLAGNIRQLKLAEFLGAGGQTSGLAGLFDAVVGADVMLEASGSRSRQWLRSLTGSVAGVAREGTIKHLDLLAALAAAAGVELAPKVEWTPTRFQSLAGDFRISDQQVEVDSARLILRGAGLELSGRVGFDGRLDLRLRGEPLSVAGRRRTVVDEKLFEPAYRLSGTLRRPEIQLANEQ